MDNHVSVTSSNKWWWVSSLVTLAAIQHDIMGCSGVHLWLITLYFCCLPQHCWWTNEAVATVVMDRSKIWPQIIYSVLNHTWSSDWMPLIFCYLTGISNNTVILNTPPCCSCCFQHKCECEISIVIWLCHLLFNKIDLTTFHKSTQYTQSYIPCLHIHPIFITHLFCFVLHHFHCSFALFLLPTYPPLVSFHFYTIFLHHF